MKTKKVIRVCKETNEKTIITMSEAIQKLNGYWLDIETNLLNGVELWTPYASYKLIK